MNATAVHGLRRFVRIPFNAPVELRIAGLTLSVQLVDISLRGALVESAEPQALELHTPCRLVLPLADSEDGAIHMNGSIVHLEGRHIGMQVLDLGIVDLTRLRRLIELNTGDSDLVDRELSLLFAKPR